jgi:hypothetical protein
MAIALIGTSQGTYSSASSWTIALPTGANVVGAITVVNAAQRGAGTISLPSGWTTLFTAPGFVVGYRVYQSGDPTSITLSSTVTGYQLCASIAYSGVDATNPIDAFNSATLGPFGVAASIMRTPSVRPNYTNSQLVVMGADNGSTSMGTYTSPSGITRQTSSNAAPNLYMGDALLSSDAITGTKDISWSTSTGGSNVTTATIMGYQLALKDASATTGTLATPTVEYAGSTFPIYYQATSVTATCTQLNPQVGDYVLIGLCGTAFPSSVPAGWTTVVSTSYGAVYGKQWASGDVNPTFTWASSSFFQLYVGVFRALGATAVQVDASGANTASSPSSIACPSLTPTSAYNELYHAYLATPGTISVSTYPSGAVYNGSRSTANGAWAAAYLQPASNPSGTQTFTGTMSGGIMAAGVLLKPVTSGNVTAALTGNHATAKFGAVVATTPWALAGNHATAKFGALTASQALSRTLTGYHAAAKAGLVTSGQALTRALTGNHASAAAGVVTSSQPLLLNLTGNHASAKAGVITSSQNVEIALTGYHAAARQHAPTPVFPKPLVRNLANAKLGVIVETGNKQIALTGNRATAKHGAVSAGGMIERMLTGALANAAARAPSATLTVALLGNQAIASARNMAHTLSRALGGQHAAGKAGNPRSSTALTRTLTGAQATGHAGAPSAGSIITRRITGAHATAHGGHLAAARALGLPGAHATGKAGDILTSSPLTGVRATGHAGTVEPVLTLMLTGYRAVARAGIFALGNPYASQSALLRTAPSQLVVQQAQNNPLAITANATMLAILSPNNIFIQT